MDAVIEVEAVREGKNVFLKRQFRLDASADVALLKGVTTVGAHIAKRGNGDNSLEKVATEFFKVMEPRMIKFVIRPSK